ncbi:MAG: ComEA family DNA-binding protein [Acidobacteriaceae bacterium]
MRIPTPSLHISIATLALLTTLLLSAQPPAPQQPSPASSHAASSAHSHAGALDINSATPQQLNALPGFGPAYTRRVIAGRPYRSSNQLVTRGVIPQSEYQRIRGLIVAHRPAR